MSADHRSVHPNIPGVPWWGAVLLAVTLTAVGFAFDAGSGDKELSTVFAACYMVGCVFAVLAVRQSGIFTAVIQPPLLLFVAVPAAYFLFHGGQLGGIKDILINCGYPLIERFPLMFFTSAVVLVIGMVRWFFGKSAGQAAPKSAAATATGSGVVSAVTSKVSSLLTGESSDEDDVDRAETPRRRHTSDRAGRVSKTTAASATRNGRTAKAASASRSRHARPAETEIIEAVVERPRRPRTARQAEQPPPAEPRRRSRTASAREPRKAAPPPDRRSAYERPERRRRFEDYQPREPHVGNGSGTHHPISRVRYRGSDEAADRPDHRSRPRSENAWQADGWEYDV